MSIHVTSYGCAVLVQLAMNWEDLLHRSTPLFLHHLALNAFSLIHARETVGWHGLFLQGFAADAEQ